METAEQTTVISVTMVIDSGSDAAAGDSWLGLVHLFPVQSDELRVDPECNTQMYIYFKLINYISVNFSKVSTVQ